ncbi:MAG: universal stress protein [Bacteroides sp.]|jgi:nucleotide-binding universal stress UspA family protein|nr:universal stress protein [Bacteroides sp.]
MTDSSRYHILVPTDLTEVSNYSIDHATEIARIFNHKIVLLHVVSKNVLGTPKEEQITQKLKENIKLIQSRAALNVSYLIEEGSIFNTISEVADRIRAEFIVMGIHGKKGVQHLMGSYAYKVVCSANVPVMVVKHLHHHVGYKNIVLPIDFMQESTQKILKAVRFSNYFGASIRVFGFLGTRNKATIFQKEALLKKVKDTFADLGVEVTTDLCVDPNRDWAEALMHFSDGIDADLILIVAEKDIQVPDIFSSNSTERIIDKADVPVLTVVPSPDDGDSENEKTLTVRSFIDPLGLTEKR